MIELARKLPLGLSDASAGPPGGLAATDPIGSGIGVEYVQTFGEPDFVAAMYAAEASGMDRYHASPIR
jgi:hypothetical protein